jgi:hypothetical protein
MPDPATGTSLNTPDPITSSEAIGAIVIGVITNLIVLFQLNLTDVQQAAIAGLVNSLLLVFVLVHGAIVRKGRAAGGGLVSAFIEQVPVMESDPGDTAKK